MRNKYKNKIPNDKYYTPIDLAKYCIDKTYEIIGKENITEIIELSAGNGSFSLQIPNCIAYDILPEHESIIKQDFLKLQISYKRGRLIIGNPPFGGKGFSNLCEVFYKKSISICDYISFILPSSYFENKNLLYEFDLKYSKNLQDKYIFTDRVVKCCFNIYKRPKNNMFNNKPHYNISKYIKIVRSDSLNYNYYKNYDLLVNGWGNVGIITHNDKYVKIFKIIIDNKWNYKNKVLDILKNFNYKEYLKFRSVSILNIKKDDFFEIIEKELKLNKKD